MNSKKLIRKTYKRNNKNKLKSRKTIKHSTRKHKKQNKTKNLSKTLNKRKQNGGECQYLKVEGMKLPDLTIPDQYGLLFDNC